MKEILLFQANTGNNQSLGFQKIQFKEQDYFVCFDGEIYNESEIRQELNKCGFPIQSCIEETILYAYEQWVDQAMHLLEGAYSFIIVHNDEILAVKDPLGLSPLFYTNNKQGFYISNRIDTLLTYSKEKAILNSEGILNLFAFGPGIPEQKTLFSNIHALAMGSKLLRSKSQTTIKRYYELPVYKHVDDTDTTIKKIHDLLTHSILQQASTTHASFLSGGLDSSIITAVCAHQFKNWHSYSLDYEGNDENFKENMYQVSQDQSFIEEMIAYCECIHTPLTISQQELCDLLESAMIARTMPGMADVDSSLLWLCQKVANKESIILSGECSDELFGGYPWFYREEFHNLTTFPWLRYNEQKIQLLNANIRNFNYQQAIDLAYKETLQQVKFLESDTKEDKKARINTTLVLHWFMQTLLTRQVCMGDFAHLKIRAPFANVKLLEYVYNIPWSMKFMDQEEKGILRKAFEKELPDRVAHRKKNPFPKTHNPNYANLIAKKLQIRFQDPNSPLHLLFDDAKLQTLITSKGASYPLPFYGQLMSGPQLLAYIYQIECWIKHYNIQIQL